MVNLRRRQEIPVHVNNDSDQHTSHSFPKLSRPSPVLFIISMIFINLLYILYYFCYIFKGNDSDLFNKSLIHL